MPCIDPWVYRNYYRELERFRDAFQASVITPMLNSPINDVYPSTPSSMHPPFHHASTHIPANSRHVLSFDERDDLPAHEIVRYDHEKSRWVSVRNGIDYGITDVTLWTELPYPENAGSTPRDYPVVQLG